MFKALYDYKSNQQKYLSFHAGDLFTLLDTSHADWFCAQNGFGEVGYVPSNYIAKTDVSFLILYFDIYDYIQYHNEQ